MKGLRDVLGASCLETPGQEEEAATYKLHMGTNT